VIEKEKETEKVDEVSNYQVFNQNLVQNSSNNLENLQKEIQGENGGVEIENEVEQEQEIAKPEKVVFKTNCSTCDEEIEVPFQPDGVRPVFCRECIKDYQRAIAKAKEEENPKNDDEKPVSSPNQNKAFREKNNKKRYNSKNQNPKAEFKEQIFVSKEKPLSFSQIPHIAPKKFADSTKKGVDFAGLREMIQKVKGEN
jgi:CxxC-x17-CxxC domain-containing protein